jgi:hypothetical protein
MPNWNATQAAFQYALTPNQPGVTIDPRDVITQPYTVSRVCNQGQQDRPLKNYQSVWKLEGMNRRALADDLSGRYEGSNTTEPVRRLNWICCYNTIDGQATVSDLPYRVSVTYYVEFWTEDYSQLPQS